MLIDRPDLKSKAKATLENKWGFAIIAMLPGALVGLLAFPATVLGNKIYREIIESQIMHLKYSIYDFTMIPLPPANIYIIVLLLMIISIFVGSAINLGIISLFIKLSRNQNVKLNEISSKFKFILKATGLYIIINFLIFLWGLLFIVPGVIAFYRYSQAFYIMAENSDIGVFEAIDLSKEMMKGNKWKKFLLDLSFIGWVILSILTLGIGFIWLVPYINTTYAHFYNEVSENYSISKTASTKTTYKRNSLSF